MVIKRHPGGLPGIVWGTWDDFWQETAISGANNAGKAREAPYIRRFIWFVIFIIFTYATLQGVYIVICEYLAFPVSTSTSIQHHNKINFPAVTICNQNRVMCENLDTYISLCESNISNCHSEDHLEMLQKLKNASCPALPPPPPKDDKDDPPSDGEPPPPDDDPTGTTDSTDTTDTTVDGTPGPTTTAAPTESPGPTTTAPVETTTASPTTTAPAGPPPSRRKRSASEEDLIDFLQTRGYNYSDDELQPHVRPKRAPPGGGPGGPGGGRRPPSQNEMGAQPASIAAEMEFLRKFMSLETYERQAIGHQSSTFIQSCTFRGRDCRNSSYFFQTNTPSYGNCYIFNFDFNENDLFGGERVSSMTGPAFGLSLVLNLEQKEYMRSGETKQAGARVTVHSSDVRPMVDEYGFDVMPNTLTEAAVHEVFLERQPEPYPSNCTSDWSMTNYTKYNQENWTYSLQQCQRFCVHSSILETCKCFHPLFLDNDSRFQRGPCNLTVGAMENVCVDSVMGELDSGDRNCSCNVDCAETDFEVYLSASTWPSDQYLATATSQYGYDNITEGGPGARENLLQVNVYFKSLNVRTVSESPKYLLTDGTLISALGGALSLYLGISIAMFFEVLEFLIDLTINLFLFCSGKRRKPDIKDKTSNKSGVAPWTPAFDYKPPVESGK